MYKSILQFCKEGTLNLEKSSADFFDNPKDIAGFVEKVSKEIIKLGCTFIGEVFDELDEAIRNSGLRKNNWEIVRKDTKKMLCSLGEFSFDKTMYKNKKTGERVYLLDRYLEMERYERLTEDAKAKLLTEVVQSSYRKAGAMTSASDSVSKGTVKNFMHELEFPKGTYRSDKKKVKYLYIDADEDHVPLQYKEKKGDLHLSSDGKKFNNALVKLVYVYEGVGSAAPGSKRHKLINPHYFSGVYEGKENKRLWEEVIEYIENTYDMDSIEKIYLNSDGGTWIKEGKSAVANVISVMDEYHINKYITGMTTHLYDSAADGREILRKTIKRKTKHDFIDVVDNLLEYAETQADAKRIETGAKYILSNWSACKIRLGKSTGVVGSSTEGHVSHVLSSRMSSRPMGWCKHGADRMAKLRAYYWNKGKMLELVRYQAEQKPMKKVAGAEEISCWEIKREEQEHHSYGKYYDKMQVSLPVQARKILAIRDRVVQF